MTEETLTQVKDMLGLNVSVETDTQHAHVYMGNITGSHKICMSNTQQTGNCIFLGMHGSLQKRDHVLSQSLPPPAKIGVIQAMVTVH